jgi:hypothetical protein
MVKRLVKTALLASMRIPMKASIVKTVSVVYIKTKWDKPRVNLVPMERVRAFIVKSVKVPV